jgi:hypothetical protein
VAEARPARLLLEQGLARVRQSLVFTAQRPLRDKPLTVQVRGGAGRARGAAARWELLLLVMLNDAAAAAGSAGLRLCARLPPAGVAGVPGPAQHQLQ